MCCFACRPFHSIPCPGSTSRRRRAQPMCWRCAHGLCYVPLYPCHRPAHRLPLQSRPPFPAAGVEAQPVSPKSLAHWAPPRPRAQSSCKHLRSCKHLQRFRLQRFLAPCHPLPKTAGNRQQPSAGLGHGGCCRCASSVRCQDLPPSSPCAHPSAPRRCSLDATTLPLPDALLPPSSLWLGLLKLGGQRRPFVATDPDNATEPAVVRASPH